MAGKTSSNPRDPEANRRDRSGVGGGALAFGAGPTTTNREEPVLPCL